MGKVIDRFIARGLLLALAVTLFAVLAACHSGGSASPAAGPSAKSAVSSLATGSAAAAAKANLAVISAKCGTATAAGQIAAVKDLGSKAGRAALWVKCGVPAAKRPQVETQALAAAEKAHLVSGGKAARAAYFGDTLPKIIEAAQA
jgi:hypothetical protein